MSVDLAAVLRALQEATGFHVVNGQFVLHIGNGSVQQIETRAFQRAPSTKTGDDGKIREIHGNSNTGDRHALRT